MSSAVLSETATVVEAAAASSRPSTNVGSNNNNGNGRHHIVHSEDLLLRSWRSTAHSVIILTGKAEKLASTTADDPSIQDAAAKEFNEATIGFLRNHVEWGRSISYLEAKLEGKAAEMESLQQYIKSHPTMGIKRKRAGTSGVSTKKS